LFPLQKQANKAGGAPRGPFGTPVEIRSLWHLGDIIFVRNPILIAAGRQGIRGRAPSRPVQQKAFNGVEVFAELVVLRI
jgi:hypothetical protein